MYAFFFCCFCFYQEYMLSPWDELTEATKTRKYRLLIQRSMGKFWMRNFRVRLMKGRHIHSFICNQGWMYMPVTCATLCCYASFVLFLSPSYLSLCLAVVFHSCFPYSTCFSFARWFVIFISRCMRSYLFFILLLVYLIPCFLPHLPHI